MKPRHAQMRNVENWPRHKAKARQRREAQRLGRPVRYRPNPVEIKPWWQTATGYQGRNTQ